MDLVAGSPLSGGPAGLCFYHLHRIKTESQRLFLNLPVPVALVLVTPSFDYNCIALQG